MYEVVESDDRFQGRIFSVVADRVRMPDGDVHLREVVFKMHAVGVVAIDDQGRVVLVRQYRHAVRDYLWELPAGLLDVDGEDPADTARRELNEETDLVAGSMEHLLDLHLSPGFTNEWIRLYLARGLTDVHADHRHVRVAEEADMQVHRFPLAEAVAMVYKGEITNAACVAGILATAHRMSGLISSS